MDTQIGGHHDYNRAFHGCHGGPCPGPWPLPIAHRFAQLRCTATSPPNPCCPTSSASHPASPCCLRRASSASLHSSRTSSGFIYSSVHLTRAPFPPPPWGGARCLCRACTGPSLEFTDPRADQDAKRRGIRRGIIKLGVMTDAYYLDPVFSNLENKNSGDLGYYSPKNDLGQVNNG